MWTRIEDIDLRLDLERATERLTEKQREAVELYLKGYTQEEIGERLGISQQGISKRLRAAMGEFSKVKGRGVVKCTHLSV